LEDLDAKSREAFHELTNLCRTPRYDPTPGRDFDSEWLRAYMEWRRASKPGISFAGFLASEEGIERIKVDELDEETRKAFRALTNF